MKQKDILTIVVVGIFSGIVSMLLSNLLIVPKNSYGKKAAVVDPITTDFTKPDPQYFNKDSFDPTKRITIGDTSNTTPFNNKR